MLVDAKAPRADAALYWRAYSLDKLNRQGEALTSVAELLKGYPSSRWIADARALEIQVRQRAGQPVSPDVQADEELKLFAIQGLQHQDPEQAIPMLEKLLQGTSSPRIKERARTTAGSASGVLSGELRAIAWKAIVAPRQDDRAPARPAPCRRQNERPYSAVSSCVISDTELFASPNSIAVFGS